MVPGCNNQSDHESHLSYHRLPLKNKQVLKIWIHKIGRKQLPLNESTRVCSEHFVNSNGRMLRSDETPTLNLPTLPTRAAPNPSRRPLIRYTLPESTNQLESKPEVHYADDAVNTNLTLADIESLETEISKVKDQLQQSKRESQDMKGKQKFRLENTSEDDGKVRFYTGFSTLTALMAL